MRRIAAVFLALLLALSIGSWTGQGVAYAAGRGGGGGGGQFSGHGGGGGHGGFVGRGSAGGGEHWRGGGGNWRGGGGRHFHGGGFRGDIWIGPGWWLDPFYYPYYPYPYYTQPPVVLPQQPEEYIMPEPQAEAPSYWYFCKDPKGYYPYVKSCPSGWMKVAPSPTPSDQAPLEDNLDEEE